MLELYIGKVVEVSNTLISVAINKELETPYIVIDSNPVRIAGVGSFLKIESSVYEIVSEKTVLESDKKEVSIKIASNRVVLCKVIVFLRGMNLNKVVEEKHLIFLTMYIRFLTKSY